MKSKREGQKKRIAIITLALTLTFFNTFFLYSALAAPTPSITISPNVYFGVSNEAEIHFGSTTALNTVLFENNYYYLNGNGFQVQNANMTINDFFVNGQLTFSLDAGTGETSTTKIYLNNLGRPIEVLINGEETSFNHNPFTKILTITTTHTSLANVIVNWTSEAVDALENILAQANMAVVISSLGIIITISVGILTMFTASGDANILSAVIIEAIFISISLFVLLIVLQGFSTV